VKPDTVSPLIVGGLAIGMEENEHSVFEQLQQLHLQASQIHTLARGNYRITKPLPTSMGDLTLEK
jgi:hypothetical protein